MLDVMHHFSSGYKAMFTKTAYEGLQAMRQACGGAGFSAWSGFSLLIDDYAPTTTYEGDNSVMTMQSGRYVMKTMGLIAKGVKAKGIFKYLNEIENLCRLKIKPQHFGQILDMDVLRESLRIKAAYEVKRVFGIFTSKANGDMKVMTDSFSIDVIGMAKAHLVYTVFDNFEAGINQFKCPRLRKHLSNLCMFYALKELQENSRPLFETGYFSQDGEPVQMIQDAMRSLAEQLRPNLLNLVEAHGATDDMIMSAIGNKYGDIYEKQLQLAKGSRLNQTKVHPAWKENMLPIVMGKL